MDCIRKVKEKLKADSLVTLKDVESMITDVMNQMDAGLTDDALLANIKDITGARKEKLKRLALMNKLNNYRKRQSRIKHIEELTALDEDVKIPLTDIVLYDAEKHAFLQSVKNFEAAVEASTTYEKAAYEAKVRSAGLLEYAKNKNNEAKIYEELEAQQIAIRDNRPLKPVTGDTAAFELAKITVENQDQMLLKLQMEGSTTGYKEKRITNQRWSMAKLATNYTKQQWVDLAISKGFKYNGAIPDRATWERVYSEVVQNTFIDDETLFDVKKQFQSSRKIEIPKDAYLEHANQMLEGDSLFERILLDVEGQARQRAILQHYGTNPKEQYKQILEQLIVRNGKSGLNDQLFKETLPAFLFGEVNAIGSPEAAKVRDVFKVIKGGTVISKLGLGFITSQADWLTTAVRQQMLRGGSQKTNVASEFIKAFEDLKGVIDDSKVVDDEINNFQIMIESVLDELRGEISKFDTELNTGDSSGLMKNILKVQGKMTKLQGIEAFTRIKSQASYRGVSRILGENANKPYGELNAFLQKRLREAEISENEWEFIRANAFADGRIMTANLKGLDSQVFKALSPESESLFALNKTKSDLMDKLQIFMFKEAKSMTLTPGANTRAQMASIPIFGSGTYKAGTYNKEISDLIMQFRSFSFTMAADFLAPMIRDADKATIFQYVGASLALNMLLIQVKDALLNRERDWTNPANIIPLIASAIGVPFVDNALGLFNGDSRIQEGFVKLFGAAPGDAFATLGRAYDLTVKTVKGEATGDDFKKAIGKTLGPAVFLRSYPIIGPVYETMMYDSFMDSIDPMWSVEKERLRQERGFKQRVTP